MSEQSQCFLLPDEEGREQCHGGPPGAELGTLTSARKWSVAHTSRLLGDFFKHFSLKYIFFFLCF